MVRLLGMLGAEGVPGSCHDLPGASTGSMAVPGSCPECAGEEHSGQAPWKGTITGCCSADGLLAGDGLPMDGPCARAEAARCACSGLPGWLRCRLACPGTSVSVLLSLVDRLACSSTMHECMHSCRCKANRCASAIHQGECGWADSTLQRCLSHAVQRPHQHGALRERPIWGWWHACMEWGISCRHAAAAWELLLNTTHKAALLMVSERPDCLVYKHTSPRTGDGVIRPPLTQSTLVLQLCLSTDIADYRQLVTSSILPCQHETRA